MALALFTGQQCRRVPLQVILSLQVYVPEFNSVVAFRVPRYHQVTQLNTSQPRYSVFGWFLQPGQLYDLFEGDSTYTQASEIRQKKIQGADVLSDKQDSNLPDVKANPREPTYERKQKILSAPANSTHALSTLLACKSVSDTRTRLSKCTT